MSSKAVLLVHLRTLNRRNTLTRCRLHWFWHSPTRARPMESHDVFVRFMQRTERRVSPFRINMVHSQSFRTGLWKLSSLGDSTNRSDGVRRRYTWIDYEQECHDIARNTTTQNLKYYTGLHRFPVKVCWGYIKQCKLSYTAVIRGLHLPTPSWS